MEVLSSRILLRPADADRSRRFYRDVIGLAVYREFGPPDDPGVVFFLGQGFLEVSGHLDDASLDGRSRSGSRSAMSTPNTNGWSPPGSG